MNRPQSLIPSLVPNRRLGNKGFFSRTICVLLMLVLAVSAPSCIKSSSQPGYSSTTTTSIYATTTSIYYPASSTTTVSQPDASSTLHLIIVADTNDYKIGRSVAVDSQNMQDLFEAIVSRSNGKLFLNKIVFEGYSVTQDNMMRAIDTLRVKSDDVIIFSYSGHGHRYQSTTSRWPLLDTLNHPTDFLTVIRNIYSKYSRQFIAIADCCNNVVDIRYREAPSPRSNDFPYEGIKRLFLNSNVKIAASGSEPGQMSYGNDYDGGHFTSAFISNLRSALFSSTGTWDMIFKNAQQNVAEKTDGDQKPQYEIR
jgi:hypothetical protein